MIDWLCQLDVLKQWKFNFKLENVWVCDCELQKNK